MPGQAGIHRYGKYSVAIAADGAIKVKRGDWISKYSAAMYNGDTTHIHEFGRKVNGPPQPLADPNRIRAGETLYHLPTYHASANGPAQPTNKHAAITLQPGETILNSASRVAGGNNNFGLGVSNAYDLYLVQTSGGDYKLVVYMRLQFFFKDSGSHKWTAAEKQKFISDWETAVKAAWGLRILKTLPNGKHVWLSFQFKTKIGGWMWDHWEITVTKLPPGGYRRSGVRSNLGTVALDSEDLKWSQVGCGTGYYKEGAHEFGHMLGLRDEYKMSGWHVVHNAINKHATDCESIMNAGMIVRHRHDATFLKYLDKWLP